MTRNLFLFEHQKSSFQFSNQTFDPNQYAGYSETQQCNHLFVSGYEPEIYRGKIGGMFNVPL